MTDHDAPPRPRDPRDPHAPGGPWAPRDPRARPPSELTAGGSPYLVSDPYQADAGEYEVVRIRSTERSTYISLLVILGVLAVFFFVVYKVVQWGRDQLDPPGAQGEEVVLSLADGATASSIAGQLEDADVIPNATAYEWYVRLKGEGISIQAGEYTLHENSAAWEVLDSLGAGPTSVAQRVQVRMTVPEGSTIAEIAQRIDATEGMPFTGADFLADLATGAHQSTLLPEGPPADAVQPLEGLLFPDTYFIDEQSGTPGGFADQQIARLAEVVDETELARRSALLGLTPYEALIVASLVEEEAGTDADRGPIARVIFNRLERDMELGVDATVVYATGGDPEITAADLEMVSPYNTRLPGNTGLTPTPISSPGLSSIEAALNPPEGDWLYYVRTEEDGGHTFAETEAEFEEAKELCVDRGYCT